MRHNNILNYCDLIPSGGNISTALCNNRLPSVVHGLVFLGVQYCNSFVAQAATATLINYARSLINVHLTPRRKSIN